MPMSCVCTQKPFVKDKLTYVFISGKKDVPTSAFTRPICGIMGTIHLVAGL